MGINFPAVCVKCSSVSEQLLDLVSAVIDAAWEEGPKVTSCTSSATPAAVRIQLLSSAQCLV